MRGHSGSGGRRPRCHWFSHARVFSTRSGVRLGAPASSPACGLWPTRTSAFPGTSARDAAGSRKPGCSRRGPMCTWERRRPRRHAVYGRRGRRRSRAGARDATGSRKRRCSRRGPMCAWERRRPRRHAVYGRRGRRRSRGRAPAIPLVLVNESDRGRPKSVRNRSRS